MSTIKYFAFAHLPAHLQAVSKPLGELAQQFEALLPGGPEKSAGMRKLLEAKDCFVRAALDAPAAPAQSAEPTAAERLNVFLDLVCTTDGTELSQALQGAGVSEGEHPTRAQFIAALDRALGRRRGSLHEDGPDDYQG